MKLVLLLLGLVLGLAALNAAPANDSFVNAQLVNVPPGGVPIAGSNLDATRERNEPEGHRSEKPVWYRMDPAPAGKGIRITSGGNGFSPEIAVYRGSIASGLSYLQLDDTGNIIYEVAGIYRQVDLVIQADSTATFFLIAGSYGDSNVW